MSTEPRFTESVRFLLLEEGTPSMALLIVIGAVVLGIVALKGGRSFEHFLQGTGERWFPSPEMEGG